ncbi:MAG: hypothetical protein FJ297_06390 [Planctomycetes bacterium]|nr:hypothetical protein [Planctomycetota bacterium]
MLAKLQQFMSDERTKRAIRSEISRRTKKAEANVGRYESQLAEVRAKIERGTENLALASREDIPGVIPLTDDDIPSPGRCRDAARFVRERGDVVYVQDVADTLGVNKAFASTLLAKAVLSGKVRNLGHQKGWTAAE